VKLARARITPFALHLRTPLATAHGRIDVRRGWLLEIEGQGGALGLGEASPLAGFGLESHAQAGRALETMLRAAVGAESEQVLARVEVLAPGAPSARAAFETALQDLAARAAGCSLATWLADKAGHAPSEVVAVNAVVAGDSPESVADAGRRAAADGFETCKLKLGARPLEDDLERVAALREAIGAGVALRVDANGAWSEPEARCALEALAGFDVELVEQPVAAPDLAGLARLRALDRVAIAADESAAGEAAARRVLAARAADWIVLKPAACGGLSACLRIAEAARAEGVGVFVTSFLDSAVGASAALQLAACLPAPLPACGLATASLFVEDLAPTAVPSAGRLRRGSGPGLGVVVDPGQLARVATGAALEIRA
jgi:o-succinylbenzoate synthase